MLFQENKNAPTDLVEGIKTVGSRPMVTLSDEWILAEGSVEIYNGTSSRGGFL